MPKTTPPTGRRVLLVTADPGGELGPAVITRLRGELRAARFEMDVATVAADAPRRGTVEDLATRGNATAALGIFFTADRVEMWAADASAGRTLMQNLPLDPGAMDRRATIVAVKAVDLLRATLAEIWTFPPGAGAAAAPQPGSTLGEALPGPATPMTVTAEPARPSRPEPFQDRFAVAAGAGWLRASNASGWAPLVALSAALGGGRLAARVTLSALGASSEVNAAAGSVELAQQLGVAELLIRSGAWHRLRGTLALGAGAHHLSVDGHGAAGFTGSNRSVWSLATAAGAGVTLDVSRRMLVAIDARAVEDLPATSVRIDGAAAARVGRPSVWIALAAGVRFP
jgi:hypothetical protein